MAHTEQEHREGLIKIYESFLNDEPTKFQKMVFKRALKALKHGLDPQKIEDWVVKIENLWLYHPKF